MEPQTLSPEEERCLELCNEFRRENGKPPLVSSESLAALAREHTEDMLEKRVPFGHTGDRDRYARIPGKRKAAENCGFSSGRPDPVQAMVTSWTKSPAHSRNLLGDWSAVGLAIGCKEKSWFSTQLFAAYLEGEEST
jgi:uncharacterized protein YkwD